MLETDGLLMRRQFSLFENNQIGKRDHHEHQALALTMALTAAALTFSHLALAQSSGIAGSQCRD